MTNRLLPVLALALVLAPAAAGIGHAQPAPMPVAGAADPARIAAGTYRADPSHTQIAFKVNHFGFNAYHGLLPGGAGTLAIDPARPAAATVAIEIPLAGVVTTSEELNGHLKSADFFDVAQHPMARFRSTSVVVDGLSARISGELTLRGVTRPVVLDARFTGAGVNPMNKAATIGFEATTAIQRSEFGIAYALPAVGDRVELTITAAFEKAQ
ncbi:polyisoprenoid-binding protein [Allostella vacuolata]|nr:polyisoprenoid-binding protein [Stella vacuolata]